jgi:hypothetical protein
MTACRAKRENGGLGEDPPEKYDDFLIKGQRGLEGWSPRKEVIRKPERSDPRGAGPPGKESHANVPEQSKGHLIRSTL